MKEQNRLRLERLNPKKAAELAMPEFPLEPPRIDPNGYIDHKVDFVASLSEDQSNSWCDEASMSANDPNNVEDEDEEYYDEEVGHKKKKRFDKDDGNDNFFKKMKTSPTRVVEPAASLESSPVQQPETTLPVKDKS